MTMTLRIVPVLAVLLLPAGCGGKESPPPGTPPAGAPSGGAAPAAGHGSPVALGSVTVADRTFGLLRHGPAVPGREGALGAVQTKGAPLGGLAPYLWLEDQAGAQVSAPVQGSLEGSQWHFHATPRKDAAAPVRAVLRLRGGSVDERAAADLRADVASQNEGVAAPILGADGKPAGYLELKLHDDKGDLELWLAKDARFAEPLDLPAATVIKAVFPALGGREIELRVRNQEKNEDEDGHPHLRQGRTDYFIFPGSGGGDATWLTGAGFASPVAISFSDGATAWRTEEFVLVPHTHGPGHTH